MRRSLLAASWAAVAGCASTPDYNKADCPTFTEVGPVRVNPAGALDRHFGLEAAFKVCPPEAGEAEIRRKAFLLTMAAASINYGDMDGKSSTGFSGSMNLDDRHQPWHDLIHEVWDFFAESGVHRYRPAPELVVGGYCLAEPGGGCLVLVLDAGEVAVDLSATAAPLTARWFECGRRVYSDGFRVEGGETVRFVPPTSEDAVLIIEVAEAGLSA